VLVKFFGWFEDSSNIFISMEYFELGDLEQHIGEFLTEDDMRDTTTDVLNGLRIMHSENFTHRDLKPGNIFVVQKPPSSKWRVIIGDFGVSRRTCYVDTDEAVLVYENAVDMWSLGCIIYRIATKKIPFLTPKAVFKFRRGILPFPEQPLLTNISAGGAEFIKSLITPNPRDRLSAVSALGAPWLSRGKRNTIRKTEESSEHHVSTVAQTAKLLDGN
jgi:serine/threonine protein kinase